MWGRQQASHPRQALGQSKHATATRRPFSEARPAASSGFGTHHPPCRGVLREAFTSLGAAVEAVDNAWAWLGRKPADVIVSDLSMPQPFNLDGLEPILIRDFRAAPREVTRPTPAIALSAYTREENRQQALASSDDVFLAKPHGPLRDRCGGTQTGLRLIVTR